MVIQRDIKKTMDKAKYDVAIANIEPMFGQKRQGDIPHSKASIQKAQSVLGYMPVFDASQGFEKACVWYWDNSRTWAV